jgi:hypothetical protein
MIYTDSKSNYSNSKDILTFQFWTVEEQPLLGPPKSTVLSVFGVLILFVGLVIQSRVHLMLKKQKQEGAAVAIDRLFKTNNYVISLFQPAFMIYWIISFSLFPMVDYIGEYGCIFFSLLLQTFISSYCLIFPLSVVILRYILVVHSIRIKKFGINKLVNTILILSLVIPIIMTLSLQYPVSDYVHGPYNYCKGRFEVYFNPTHPDAITPGRREGEKNCVESKRWANDSMFSTRIEHFFKVSVFISCTISRHLLYILTMSLPEMVLYPLTFRHIIKHNKQV